MISEKGLLWASDYWSANVYQQASNSLNNADEMPYGAKGDARWQLIALSEGWANYREWKLAHDKLDWNSIYKRPWKDDQRGPDVSNNFPIRYGAMFDELQIIGCSYSNMERALASYNFTDFRDKLISYHLNLSTQITDIITRYENFTF